MKKILFGLVLGTGLTLAVTSALAALPPLGFKDVPPGSWFFGPVNNLKNFDIISGYEDGTFRPGRPVTRAEAAVMLEKLRTRIESGDIGLRSWITAQNLLTGSHMVTYMNMFYAGRNYLLAGAMSSDLEKNRQFEKTFEFKVIDGTYYEVYAAQGWQQKKLVHFYIRPKKGSVVLWYGPFLDDVVRLSNEVQEAEDALK